MDGTPYGPSTHCVLHVDVDAFFCQVEMLRNPSLRGIPIAIIQDRDVIAVSYPARQAGVRKYMDPAKARDLLQAAGGRLVRVFQESDTRVSYRPYREASAALMRLLRSGLLAPHSLAVKVVEKASIDEAFLLIALPHNGSESNATITIGGQNTVPVSNMVDWVQSNLQLSLDLSAGAAVAAAVRAAVQQSLGLTVSVGVASNKLLAKLASRQAKPDGVAVIDSVQRVQHLLTKTPVDRIPGLGGAVAAALVKHGITHIAQLQQHSPAQLLLLLGGQQQAKLAERLIEAGWGRDAAAVVDKGPPKSIQVQLALNAHLWRARLQEASEAATTAAALTAPAAAAPEALSVGGADTLSRLEAILQAVAGDLLGRVMLDRHSEDRWPKKLALTLGIYIPGQQPRAASKSTAFPPPALLLSAPTATAAGAETCNQNAARKQGQPQQQETPGVQQPAVNQPPPSASGAPAFFAPGVVGEKSFIVGAALHERVVQLASGLAQAILAPLPSQQCVGHLNLSVGNFGPFEAAATAGDIRRFATATAKTTPHQQQEVQVERAQQECRDRPGAAAVEVVVQSQEQQRYQQHHQQQPAYVVESSHKSQRSATAGGDASRDSMQEPGHDALQQHQERQQQALDSKQVQQTRRPQIMERSRGQQITAVDMREQQQEEQQHSQQHLGEILSLSDHPPVLLSTVLRHLAQTSTTGQAAEEHMDRLLSTLGLTRLLQPLQQKHETGGKDSTDVSSLQDLSHD